ncbi:MAG: putative lipopolysaccharide heptosyltransferase III [Helicobacter sp.]|nr:putative lipopolysaccharide heptosyltransferase III [Helicobacter sp.]
MKILVVKFRNIGDVLLTTPLFANLRAHFPSATIHAAINAESLPMLEGNPNIDAIFPYERARIKKLGILARLREEWRYLRQFRSGYDVLINTTEGERGAWIAQLCRPTIHVAPARSLLLRPTHLFTPYKGHIIDHHLEAISLLGHEIVGKAAMLVYGAQHLARLHELGLPPRYVHFHPLSRWQFKCIDDALSAAIIDYIQNELGIPVVLSAAPNEAEMGRIATILSLCASEPLNFAGKLNLKELAALAGNATAFVGVDTATMHIAAALDTPTIAFFVASAVFHWGAWDNALTDCPYTDQDGIQRMGKHSIFVKNSARKDRDIMQNREKNGTFTLENFDWEAFRRELSEKLR